MSDSIFFGGVFAQDGTMLGNQTSNLGQIPSLNPVPGITSSFAPSATSQGTAVVSLGGPTGNAAVSATGAPTSIVPSNAAAGSQPATSSGVTSGSLADYFFRGVIIILGFIFVAIGLNMFRPGLVPVPGLPGNK